MPASTLTTLPLQIGINPYTTDDSNITFADAMKQARPWGSVAQPYTPSQGPALDSNGWPMGDGGIIVYTVPQNSDPALAAGRYTVTFTGQADFGYSVTPATSSPSYNSATNTTTIFYDVAANNPSHSVYLTFSNTRRLPSDSPGTGLTNLQIMRPIAPGATTSHDPTEYLARQYIPTIGPFPILRTMDWFLINAIPATDFAWSMRTLPGNPSQNNGQGPGMAIEHAIKIANSRPASFSPNPHDLWFNVPDTATDDFITKAAQTIKYGSDGSLPYTGPIGSAVTSTNPRPAPPSGPIWAALKGRPTFEYSNETWDNTIGIAARLRSKGQALAQSSPSTISWDGQTDPVYLGFRMNGLGCYRVRNLVGQVFGEDRFNLDFFVALGNKLGNGPELTEPIALINHQEAAVAAQNGVAARPLNQLITTTTSNWYHSFNNEDLTSTVDQIFAEGVQGYPYTRMEQSVVGSLGIASSGYEGNLNIGEGDGSLPFNDLTRATDLDGRIRNPVIRVINDRIADGMRTLIAFNTTTGPWALCPDNNVTGPKFGAFADYARHLELGNPLVFNPAVAAVAIPAPDPSLPTIADYGFETASLGTLGNAYKNAPTDTPWTWVNPAGVSGNQSAYSGNNPNAMEGKQFAIIQNAGSATQTITGWAAGSYVISMLISLRGAAKWSPQAVDVQIDGNVVGTLIPISTDWAVYTTPSFTVTAGSHTLTLQGRNLLSSATDCTAFVDAVVIGRAMGGGMVTPTPTVPTVPTTPTTSQLCSILTTILMQQIKPN